MGDEELIKNLMDNKKEFDSLVSDLLIDCGKGLSRIDVDWTDPKNPEAIGVSDNKIAAYRARFISLGINRGYSSISQCKKLN